MKYLFYFLLSLLLFQCNSSNDIIKDPLFRKCEDVEGIQISEESFVPNGYNGKIKKCEIEYIQIEGTYKNGRKHGIFNCFFNGEKLITKFNFDNDLLHGKQLIQYYHDKNTPNTDVDKPWNEMLTFELVYEQGLRHGTSKVITLNGKLIKELYFENDSLINTKCYDQYGNLCKCNESFDFSFPISDYGFFNEVLFKEFEKELDLSDLKVELKEDEQYVAPPEKKTNSRKKLTSNQTEVDETPSGSERQSDNTFGNGGTVNDSDQFGRNGNENQGVGPNGNSDGTGDDGDRFGRNGNGNHGDGPDDCGNGNTRGNADRKLINQPSIPQYEINYDCQIVLKISLNDNGTVRAIKWINKMGKEETNCNDINIINDVMERVKSTIKYNTRTPEAKDHAFFIVRFESR
jgi:hypothetical protein